MRSTLDEFLATIRDLDVYVQSIEPVNSTLASVADPMIRGYLTVRRQLDSAAFIVLLYAAFEKFVEDLVWSHTELLSATIKYDDLSDALRKKHVEQSASLLAKGRLGEGRYVGLTPAAAIANLHQCVSGARPYKLNQHAILYHENNLRPSTVHGLFLLTGVSGINDLAGRAEPMLKWNLTKNGALDPVALTSIETRVNDIVELRNQAAHTGLAAGQVLGAAEMREHLGFMAAYCSGLYEVIVGAYLDRTYVEAPGASIDLGPFLEGPFDKHGGAVVVRKPTCRIYVGQPVIGKCDGRVRRWGIIQEIKVNDRSVLAVEVGDPVADVGLRLDFAPTKNTRLYLLPTKDDAVWS
jgi:hypothetical protein